MGRRSLGVSYVLWALLGYLGAHRFYLRDWGWGALYLLTGGLFAIGYLADAFLLPGRVDAANRRLDAAGLAPARVVKGGRPAVLAVRKPSSVPALVAPRRW